MSRFFKTLIVATSLEGPTVPEHTVVVKLPTGEHTYQTSDGLTVLLGPNQVKQSNATEATASVLGSIGDLLSPAEMSKGLAKALDDVLAAMPPELTSLLSKQPEEPQETCEDCECPVCNATAFEVHLFDTQTSTTCNYDDHDSYVVMARGEDDKRTPLRVFDDAEKAIELALSLCEDSDREDIGLGYAEELKELVDFITKDNESVVEGEEYISAEEYADEAASVLRQRAADRDLDKERSMEATVKAFNAIHGTDLTVTEGWLFMNLLKQARAASGTFNPDDYVDMGNYAFLAGEDASRGR